MKRFALAIMALLGCVNDTPTEHSPALETAAASTISEQDIEYIMTLYCPLPPAGEQSWGNYTESYVRWAETVRKRSIPYAGSEAHLQISCEEAYQVRFIGPVDNRWVVHPTRDVWVPVRTADGALVYPIFFTVDDGATLQVEILSQDAKGGFHIYGEPAKEIAASLLTATDKVVVGTLRRYQLSRPPVIDTFKYTYKLDNARIALAAAGCRP